MANIGYKHFTNGLYWLNTLQKPTFWCITRYKGLIVVNTHLKGSYWLNTLYTGPIFVECTFQMSILIDYTLQRSNFN